MLQSYGQQYGLSSSETASYDDETMAEPVPEVISNLPTQNIQGELFKYDAVKPPVSRLS